MNTKPRDGLTRLTRARGSNSFRKWGAWEGLGGWLPLVMLAVHRRRYARGRAAEDFSMWVWRGGFARDSMVDLGGATSDTQEGRR